MEFQLLVTPLIDFWDTGAASLDERLEALGGLQEALSEVCECEVSWEETSGGGADDGAPMDPFALYAVVAAAAWAELHGSLEGFDTTDDPWTHPALDEVEEQEVQRFRQLLHLDADMAVFAPVDLPDVYFVEPYSGEEEEPDEDDIVAVGSLIRLSRELDALRVMLELPADIDPYDSSLAYYDVDANPNAAVNWGLALLRAKVEQAKGAGQPLVLWLGFEDEDDEDGDDDA